MTDAMPCDHQRQGGVEVFMDDHFASGQGGSPLGALDLYDQVAKVHGVVAIDGTLEALGEDQLEVPVTGQKGRTSLSRRHCESAVELGDVVLGEKCVGRIQR